MTECFAAHQVERADIKLKFLITLVCVKHLLRLYQKYCKLLSILDDSIDAVEVEFVQWRLYWLRHKDDSLPYNASDALLSAKEMKTYSS